MSRPRLRSPDRRRVARSVRKAATLPSTISLETPVGQSEDGGAVRTLGEVLPSTKESPEELLDVSMLRTEL